MVNTSFLVASLATLTPGGPGVIRVAGRPPLLTIYGSTGPAPRQVRLRRSRHQHGPPDQQPVLGVRPRETQGLEINRLLSDNY
jgi:hypothetical protein